MKTLRDLGPRWVIGIVMILSSLILAPSLLEAEYVNQPMNSVDGSFTSSGFVSEPFIVDLELFNFSQSTETAIVSGQAMTPQVEHQLTFKVGYADGFGDNDNPLEDFFVNIKVLYLEDCTLAEPCSEAELIEAFDNAQATTPDAGVFDYNFSPSAFNIVTDGTIHTWDILANTGVTAVAVEDPQSEELVSGYAFDFRFKPSKTALEDFADGAWMVMIEFGINNGPSGYENLTGYHMEWYGEIGVDPGTEAIWTGLDVQEFNNSDADYRYTNLTNTSIDDWNGIRYISNGPYIHTNQANENTWTSDTEFEATLITSTAVDHPLNPQEFMIRINTLNTFDPTLKAQQLVNDRVDLNNMLQRSLETGREKNFYVFVRLAPVFQNATYQGTIDFGISNLPSDQRPNVEKSTVEFMFGDGQYPTERIPLTSREDLAALNISEAGFIVIGEGTVYERLYDISPIAEDFVLAGNINLSSAAWTPIGTASDPFTGSLIGNQYEIQDLHIPSGDNLGLFGFATNATFENLVLTNVAITGGANVGALVGSGTTVTITDVKVSGTVSGQTEVGAVAGFITQNSQSILTQLENFASVTGSERVGGLVGAFTGILQESINRGPVSANGGSASDIGGLVGITQSNGSSSQPVTVKNSYNTGTINGNSSSNVGGIIGRLAAGTLENSMNIGEVHGSSDSGGVVGSASDPSNIIRSVFKQTESFNPGVPTVGSAGQVDNLADDQLRNVYNFEDWDFSEAWGINVFDDSVNNRFPKLQWEGQPILDIRADIIPPSESTLSGIETFTIRAAVGPSHPAGLENWTLELIQDPNNENDERQVVGVTTFGSIGINQSINIDTIFRRNLEHKYLLTVTDTDGRVVTKSAVFNIFNPVASGAVNIIEDGDDQIVVNFDSDVSLDKAITGSAFNIQLFEFDIENTDPTPDPTTFDDADIDDSDNLGRNPTTIDPSRVTAVTLENNVLTITIDGGITLPAGDRFYFRLEFLEEAQESITNIGNNPLSTRFARDLVRPLAIRVSDFTSGGLSGSSGYFPRGYTFVPTEDIIVTRLIGGHNGSSSNDVFELRLYEVNSITNPRPLDVNNPIVRFELVGASSSNNNPDHHFAQSEYKIGEDEEGVRLEEGKVYLLVQFRVSGGGSHYRASGTIDYNQINDFNSRISNWGPTTGGNWRFVGGGLSAIETARIESETTRPSLGFRYVPEDADRTTVSGNRWDEDDAKPAQD